MTEEEKKTADTGQQEEAKKPETSAEGTKEQKEEKASADTKPETEKKADGKEEAAAADASAKDDKKASFFKKNDKKEKELQDKIDALNDQLRRQMAEFDNYRKRTDREKEQMFSNGEANVIEKILPVVDNFERGFDTVQDEDKDDAFVKGMQKIYSQLQKELTDLGVKPIDCVGKPFDPSFHNAVQQVEDDTKESGTVAVELQKGYMYHDKVIRHSMVAVVS
ncbi:MAG TPA: nucleotide exchange factor GrpE [Lachnospiraceae bacterium]|jgi:molecular chaperone GrpE|nr:nucleotide exchange factor GrpE [Lachnospiraceae bacterium]